MMIRIVLGRAVLMGFDDYRERIGAAGRFKARIKDSTRESPSVRPYRPRLPSSKPDQPQRFAGSLQLAIRLCPQTKAVLEKTFAQCGAIADMGRMTVLLAVCDLQGVCQKETMRRKIFEEPVSRAAIWSGRMAWMGIAVTVIAVLLTRGGRIEFEAGRTAILSGLAFGVLAVILALAAFARIWMEGRRGLGSAIAGFVLGVLLLAFPAYLLGLGIMTPQPRDIATDLSNPPQFSRSPSALAARSGWTGGALPATERILFRREHPGLAPVVLDLPLEEAFTVARRAAVARGLTIIEAEAPSGSRAGGSIEARTQTWVLRLPVEITIRVIPLGEGARIDARAAAPAGNHDIGTNVSELRAYLEEVDFIADMR